MALRRKVAHNRHKGNAAEEFLEGIRQHQEKELERIRSEQKREDENLAKAQADLRKAQADLRKAQADLQKAETDLGKSETDLGKAETDLGKAETDLGKAETDLGKAEIDLGKAEADLGKAEADLGKAEADLGKEEANLVREQEILKNKKSFTSLSQNSTLRYKEADALLSQFIRKIKDRTLLATSLIKKIVACDETKEAEAFRAEVARLQSKLPDVEKIIQEENEVQRHLLSKMDEVEETINQIKTALDQLPADRTPYSAQINGYDNSVTCFSKQCEDFESMRPHKKAADELCTLVKYNISELEEKLKAQQNSPPSSSSYTPPSDSEISKSSALSIGTASAADEMEVESFSSSADISPERSPKKGESDEKETAMQNQFAGLVLEPKSPAPQLLPKAAAQPPASSPAAAQQRAATPALPTKKGIFSGLFGKKSKEPAVDVAVTPAHQQQAQQVRSGSGFNQR
jgi:chromosome segregation ATPase